MPSPAKPANTDSTATPGRKSTRLAIAIPIALSGKNSSGAAFKENTRTITINRHGAKVATTQALTLGAEVVIENRHLGTIARANVVWLGEKKGPKDSVEIGVQLLEASNIWGIEFPPEDWQEGPPAQAGPGTSSLEGKPPSPVPTKSPAEVPAQKPAATVAGRAPVTAPAAARATLPATPAAATASWPPRTPGTTPVPPQPIQKAIAAAIEQFNAQAEKALEGHAKTFEDRLARYEQEVGFQSQAQLQRAANALEEKLVASLEEKVNELGEQLEASRKEFELLLTRYRELQESGARETEKTKQNIEEAGFAALQSAVEQLSEAAEKELGVIRQEFVDEIRKRVSEEGAASVEQVSTEAQKKLGQLVQEHAGQAEAQSRESIAQALESMKTRVAEVAGAGEADFRDRVGTLSTDALPRIRSEIEGFAAREFESRRSEFIAAIDREVGERSARALENFSQDAQKRLSSLRDDLVARTEADLQGLEKVSSARSTEAVQEAVRAATASGIETLEKDSARRVEAVEAQAEKAAKKVQEKAAREISAHLEKVRDELLASQMKEFQKELGEARTALKDELKSSWKTLADEAKKQLGIMTQTTVEALNKEGKSGLEEFRAHLKKSAQENIEKASSALEAELRKAEEAKKQLGTMTQTTVEALNNEGKSGLEEFRAHLKKSAQENIEKASSELEIELRGAAEHQRREQLIQLEKESGEAGARVMKEFERRMSEAQLASTAAQAQFESRVAEGERASATAQAQIEATLARLPGAASEAEAKVNALIEARAERLREETDTAEKQREELTRQLIEQSRAAVGDALTEIRAGAEQAVAETRNAAREARSESEAARDASNAASAELRTKSELAVKEASDVVNKHIGSGAVFLKELEEQARGRLGALSEKMDSLVRASQSELEKNAADFSTAAMQGMRASSDILADQFHEQIKKSVEEVSTRFGDDLNRKMEAVTEKLVEESAALLSNQNREGLELAAAELEKLKDTLVNETEEAIRARLAEAFSSVFMPGGRRVTDRTAEEAKKKP